MADASLTEPNETERNPLFNFTTEELVEELRIRYPAGICFLMRTALGNDDIEYFNPIWGNPFLLLGILERQMKNLHNVMDYHAQGIGPSTAGDEVTERRAWDGPPEEGEEGETGYGDDEESAPAE